MVGATSSSETWSVDDPARGQPGAGDEERDAHALLVERVAVLQAAVLAKLLAVVGGDDDDRAIEETPRA